MAIEQLTPALPLVGAESEDRRVRRGETTRRPASRQTSALWIRFLTSRSWVLLAVGWSVCVGALIATGYWAVVVATVPVTLVCIAMLHFISRRTSPAGWRLTTDSSALKAQTAWLLWYATLYPLALFPLALWIRGHPTLVFPGMVNSPLVSYANVVVDKLLMLLVPTVLFAYLMGGVRKQLGLSSVPGWRRWLPPLLPLSLFVAPQLALAVAHAHRLSPGVGLAFVAVAFVYAGLPEEALYRALLQSRLEALIGRRNGIAIASFLFTLRHVPPRFALIWLGTTSSPLLDLALTFAVCMTVQLPCGVLFGYAWSRYRNLWLNVGVHTTYDAANFVTLMA